MSAIDVAGSERLRDVKLSFRFQNEIFRLS